ncbi:hypothetical protein XI05_19325 [Bradyrhizobium sp. CCBAU 11357]|nr:hypothetical protein [Bradyrhizobium sp. CCBAU 11357]
MIVFSYGATIRSEMRPEWPQSARVAFLVSLALFVTLIATPRRISGADAPRLCKKSRHCC